MLYKGARVAVRREVCQAGVKAKGYVEWSERVILAP
jgi:hypothetical protein